MLIIRKVLDTKLYDMLCEKCGAEKNGSYLSYFAGESRDLGETIESYLGFLQFRINEAGAEIKLITALPDVYDNEAIIIMSRVAMEFLHSGCGCKNLYIKKGAADETLIKVLGFEKTENNDFYYLNLEEFFASPCEYNKSRNL